jgi:RimJ/RimL family protein N-acetyltransferase
MSQFTIETNRLGLRNWIESDITPFASMCEDPEVMKHFPSVVSKADATAFVRSYQQHFEEFGFTYFAVEELNGGEFIGFVGIKHQTYESPFTPCVDIGWRLKRSAWGKGYATEAAKACLEFAFESAKLEEIFAMCTNTNAPSESVMKKIGMEKAGTFEHPAIAANSLLNPCLAYRIGR